MYYNIISVVFSMLLSYIFLYSHMWVGYWQKISGGLSIRCRRGCNYQESLSVLVVVKYRLACALSTACSDQDLASYIKTLEAGFGVFL